MNNECVIPCNEKEEFETISKICRDNSAGISRIYNNLCVTRQFVEGIPTERNLDGTEPQNMREEILWQRSMLERIDNELREFNHTMGV